MGWQGLEVTSQTLWDQIHALHERLVPTWQAMKEHVLASPQIGADETWWRDLKTGSKQCHDWCVCCKDGVYHEIYPSRSAKAAGEMLAGYTGTVMTDGYSAYKTLAKAMWGLKLVHCWAHARRKFVEAEPFYPQECEEILDRIGKLYEVERAVPKGEDHEAVLIGAGHLGGALLAYTGFERYGFHFVAAFDSDPKKIGREIDGVEVRSMRGLKPYIRRHRIRLAVLTVPVEISQTITDRLMAVGVKAIWNFTPTHLSVPEDVLVRNEHISLGLSQITYHLKGP